MGPYVFTMGTVWELYGNCMGPYYFIGGMVYCCLTPVFPYISVCKCDSRAVIFSPGMVAGGCTLIGLKNKGHNLARTDRNTTTQRLMEIILHVAKCKDTIIKATPMVATRRWGTPEGPRSSMLS